MAKTRSVTFKVRVKTGNHGGTGDMPGFLDMLRYEGGVVTDWSHDAGLDTANAFTVTVRVADHFRHQPARWLSFGIRPMYDVPQAADGLTGREREVLAAGMTY